MALTVSMANYRTGGLVVDNVPVQGHDPERQSHTERLLRALPVVLTRIERFTRISGLGPAAFMVLARLASCSTCTVSELSDWMGVSRPTVTGITNNLAGQGLISRVREDDDRRVVHISLTSAGRTMVLDARSQQLSKMGTMLSNLPPADVESLVRIIEQLAIAGENDPVRTGQTREWGQHS